MPKNNSNTTYRQSLTVRNSKKAKINTNLKPKNLSSTYDIPAPSAKSERKPAKKAARQFPNSAETASNGDSSDDFELDDMEFIDLPGSRGSSPVKAEKKDWEKLYNEEKTKRKEEEKANQLVKGIKNQKKI